MTRLLAFLDQKRTARQDLAILALCLFIAYGSSLATGFVADDLILVKNAQEASWSVEDLSRSFHLGVEDLTDGWAPPQIAAFRLYFFRPLYMALLKAEVTVFGSWLPGYHITNLLLQFLVIALFYVWAADFGFTRPSRFLAALLFLLYMPNHMTVNWVAGRTEIMAAAFIISSVLFLGRFHKTRKPGDYAISMGALLFAMGTKENAVIIPFIHLCAALFLYAPAGKWREGLKARLLAILPFFIMLPPYFLVRGWALGGFPVPPRGFYFHPMSDPDIVRFLTTKLGHAVLSLVYQLPAGTSPAMLERSIPTVAIMAVFSLITATAIIRWLKAPIRYFLLGWIAFTLAPTMPLGLNPIYYYLTSPALALFYVLFYRHCRASEVPWLNRSARWAMTTLIALGFVVCMLSGPSLRFTAVPAYRIAAAAAEVLEEYPEVTCVYLLDIPHSANFIVPEIRLIDDRYRTIEFRVLSLSPKLTRTERSRLEKIDEHTFDSESGDGTYFTTAIEQVVFAKDVIEFQEGVVSDHPEYEIEVMEIENHNLSRKDHPFFIWLRGVYNMPGEEQMGVKRLRYRFTHPLNAKDRIYLRAVDFGVEVVDFDEPMR